MELPGEGIFHEDGQRTKLSRRLSFGNDDDIPDDTDDLQFASPRTSPSPVPNTSFVERPKSPITPWNLSPVRSMTSSQPLLYHCIASLHRHQGSRIFSTAVTKDFLFIGSESSRVHVWKQPECTEVGYIRATAGEVGALLAHVNVLFTAHSDFRIRVWHITDRDNFQAKKIRSMPRRNSFLLFPKKSTHQHKDHISCMAYNEIERLLYTGSWDKTVRTWKVPENRCVDSFVAHDGHVNAIQISQEDGYVFTCSSDGSIKIWRRVFGESSHILTMTLKFRLSPVNALALSSSPSTCLLYSGSSDGLINFWVKDRTSGRYDHRAILQGHHFGVLCLLSVGDLILSGSEDATIRIWRRAEEGSIMHSCLAVIEGHCGPVRCLAASLEMENMVKSLLVYSASSDQTLKIWRVKVFPTEKVNLQPRVVDQTTEVEDGEASPVLSPSWVGRKLHANLFQ